jgi:hypothetical protein
MTVHLAEHVAWREIEGATFIIDLRTKRMYGLNATGSKVWNVLASEGGDLEAAARLLGGSEVASSASTSRAVQDFCGELARLELVTGVGSHGDTTGGDVAPEVPPTFLPPQIVWQEELRSFGFSCARIEGQSPACDQGPTT